MELGPVPPSRVRLILQGLVQAAGMGVLARFCEMLLAGVLASVAALGDDWASAWWSSAPAWLLFVWLSKRAAVSGWWRKEGALACGALALILFFLGWMASGRVGSGLGWLAAAFWACLWPFAREQVESLAKKESSK